MVSGRGQHTHHRTLCQLCFAGGSWAEASTTNRSLTACANASDEQVIFWRRCQVFVTPLRYDTVNGPMRRGDVSVVTPFESARREHEQRADNETYCHILQAAHHQISLNGYHGVIIEDIVKQAGVSRATFYFYFRNKQHLFIQVANDVMNQMYEVAGRHYPNEDEYTRIVLANAAYLDVWRHETKIISEFFALSLVDDAIHQIYDRHRRRFEERIEGRLTRLLVQERIPAVDPKLLAATLSAMVEFFAFRFFATSETVSARHYRFPDAVRILSESWYRAVYGRTPPEDYAYDHHLKEDATHATG